MSRFNQWMHPDNPYKTPPNFKDLALKYDDFRKHVVHDISGKMKLDFKNQQSLACLAKTLLKEDFSLDVMIPEGCLVPTIPSRLNYLLWIRDVLKKCGRDTASITGIDIGTGASCVYPLLGARHFGWRMRATEQNQDNYEAACNNIEVNNLSSMVSTVKVNQDEILSERILEVPSSWASRSGPPFDFTMCNPPFYAAEQTRSDTDKVGKDCEISTSGGEINFVIKLFNTSRQFRNRVRMFSSLLGHKSSLDAIKFHLKSQTDIKDVSHSELYQGRTMRWVICWTFMDDMKLTGLLSTKAKKEKSKPFAWTVSRTDPLQKGKELRVVKLFHLIKQWLQEIDVDVTVKKESKYIFSAHVVSRHRKWQNQRKMRRQATRSKEKDSEESSKSSENIAPVNLSLCKFSELPSRVDEARTAKNGLSAAENAMLDVMLTPSMMSIFLNSQTTDAPNMLSSTAQENSRADASISDNDRTSADNVNSTDLENGAKMNFENGAKSQLSVSNSTSSNGVELCCDLLVRVAGPLHHVELSYLDGPAGRDGTHQLLQYLKNRFAEWVRISNKDA